MDSCQRSGLAYGAVGAGIGAAAGVLFVNAEKTMWAFPKKVALVALLAVAGGGLTYYGRKASCSRGAVGLGAVGAVPRQLRCPKVRGISKATWNKGIKVEKEHTKDRATARCIAAAHLEEDHNYYTKLARMEAAR